MIKFYNDSIPFGNYVALTFWPIIFVKKEYRHKFNEVAENHENIHGRQQVEMLIVGAVLAVALYFLGCGWWSLTALPVYFVIYILEWLVRLVAYGFNQKKAYRMISAEQEAYAHEADMDYISHRRPFAWLLLIAKWQPHVPNLSA